MATSANGVPAGLVREVFMGLQSNGKAPVANEIVGRTQTVNDGHGTTFLLPSVTTLPKAEDKGLPPGSPVQDHDAEMSKFAYTLLMYKQTAKIPFMTEQNWRSASGGDIVAERLEYCQEVSNLKVDLNLEAILKDTDLNLAQDVTAGGDGNVFNGAWNSSSGTPLNDLKYIGRNLIPGARTITLGGQLADGMCANPQFTAKATNFSGSAVSNEFLVQTIKKETPFDTVEVIDKFYNVKAEGLEEQVEFIFPTDAWIGYGRDLIKFDLGPNNPRPLMEEKKVDEYTRVGYSQYSQFKRPTKRLGMVVQNAFDTDAT